ncbi:MAG: hypothetical protein ACXACX_20310, partial [Candidatus Hodarchaeales archaeon]
MSKFQQRKNIAAVMCFALYIFWMLVPLSFVQSTDLNSTSGIGSSIDAPHPSIPLLTEGYTQYQPINISDNSEFSVFNGSGTITDPYMIKGLEITNATGILIEISNTDVHFIIKDCYLIGGEISIFLLNVQNGQLINNTM